MIKNIISIVLLALFSIYGTVAFADATVTRYVAPLDTLTCNIVGGKNNDTHIYFQFDGDEKTATGRFDKINADGSYSDSDCPLEMVNGKINDNTCHSPVGVDLIYKFHSGGKVVFNKGRFQISDITESLSYQDTSIICKGNLNFTKI